MKTKLEKIMKKHLDHCKMWEFQLQENRHCTCGRDGAEEEVVELIWDHIRLMDMRIDDVI